MLNRFFVAEAQDVFLGLQCEGDPSGCDIARTTNGLRQIETAPELEAYKHVLAPIACDSCIECVQKKLVKDTELSKACHTDRSLNCLK